MDYINIITFGILNAGILMTPDYAPPFVFFQPAELRVPFLFNSPHSGRIYTSEFLSQTVLNSLNVRRSEDSYVDLFFKDVVRLGAGFMAANFPRAYVDVNREPDEIDAEMISEPLLDFSAQPSVRVLAGLGLIPRIVAKNIDIYDKKIPLDEVLFRIQNCYFPYHAFLSEQLCIIREQFGFAILIDCHSMPGKLEIFQSLKQPDFILGDRHGRSCTPALTLYASELLRDKGYNVSLNHPYSGGYITKKYGIPKQGLHALQLEINRNLYLNEISLEVTKNFESLRNDLVSFSADLMSIPENEFILCHQAAE